MRQKGCAVGAGRVDKRFVRMGASSCTVVIEFVSSDEPQVSQMTVVGACNGATVSDHMQA